MLNHGSGGDLGWTTWQSKQYLEVIRLWLRLKNMNSTRLTKKVFKHNLTKAVNCKIKNWELTVINLFDTLGFDFLRTIESCDTKSIIKDCKERLLEMESIAWNDGLWNDINTTNGNKLRCYRSFKDKLSTENYVYINIPLFKKKVFSRLRAGCLALEVETGRHRKPHPLPLKDRICRMCNSSQIEDEKHFVISCDLYIDLRNILFDHCKLLNQSFTNLDENRKFTYIMQNGDLMILNTIFKMFARRALFTI